MTNVALTMTLPTSSYYSGSGATTITLTGVNQIGIDSGKLLTKVPLAVTPAQQTSQNNDRPRNMVIDLKMVNQTIKFSGFLEDDATQTAWNKLWKLTAMQTHGGPLTTLTIGTASPITFSSGAVYPTNPPSAFVENISSSVTADDTGDITASNSQYPARIKVDLTIYLGYPRA